MKRLNKRNSIFEKELHDSRMIILELSSTFLMVVLVAATVFAIAILSENIIEEVFAVLFIILMTVYLVVLYNPLVSEFKIYAACKRKEKLLGHLFAQENSKYVVSKSFVAKKLIFEK